MRCVAIVQARLGSSRLPNKVLALIEGKPMIQHVVERAQAIPNVDHVNLAVPEEELAEFYLVRAETGCGLVGGPRDDVLARYALAAKSSNADVIVRITGDCPLLCPEVSKFVLDEFYGAPGYDLYYNTAIGNGCWIGIDGLDTEVFGREALDRAHKEAAGLEREHVTACMRRTMKTLYVPSFSGFEHLKLSVDAQADLERVRRIMARIPAGDYSWEATRKAIEEETLC